MTGALCSCRIHVIYYLIQEKFQMRDSFKMTDIVGIERAAVPHNNCGKKDVGVAAGLPDFAQCAIDVGGNVNRVIVKRVYAYLPQKCVEQRFFFWAGFVAESFKDFIDGDGCDGYFLILPRVLGYPVNHRLIIGKEV
jgi:hypothetical protein